MVTAIYVQNYTKFAFDCSPMLDSEELDEVSENYWQNLRYNIKSKYSVRIAELSRDYLFRSGQIYYFSFYLSISTASANTNALITGHESERGVRHGLPHDLSKCLILKVKNEESEVKAELLYGVHSLPYGTCYPEFSWKHSTSGNTTYWAFFDGPDRSLCCIEIKYRSIFSGGDSDLEFVLSEVEIPSKNWSEIQDKFAFPLFNAQRGKIGPELVVEECTWEYQSKIVGVKDDFTPTMQSKDTVWMYNDDEKCVPIWSIYLPSPRWSWLDEHWQVGPWTYSPGSTHSTVWTNEPPSTPRKIRRRQWTRRRICPTFFRHSDRELLLHSATPMRRAQSKIEMNELIEGVSGMFKTDWLVQEFLKLNGDASKFAFFLKNINALLEEEPLCRILDAFEYECNKLKVLQYLKSDQNTQINSKSFSKKFSFSPLKNKVAHAELEDMEKEGGK